MAVWDTSVASGLHPDSPLFELASEAALSSEPILLAPPTVQEIAFGLQRKAPAEPKFQAALSWFTEILDAGVLSVLPLSWEAALLAGRLRAAHPAPPALARSQRSSGTKPERRVAWVTDIQIAASAWLAAESVCTTDQAHFELLSDAIADLHPGEGTLGVLPPPALDRG